MSRHSVDFYLFFITNCNYAVFISIIDFMLRSTFEKDIITPSRHPKSYFWGLGLFRKSRATVVQFRLGRQISNLETQVQILAVALKLIHGIVKLSSNILKQTTSLGFGAGPTIYPNSLNYVIERNYSAY